MHHLPTPIRQTPHLLPRCDEGKTSVPSHLRWKNESQTHEEMAPKQTNRTLSSIKHLAGSRPEAESV